MTTPPTREQELLEARLEEAKWWSSEESGEHGLCAENVGCSACKIRRERLADILAAIRALAKEGK